MVQQLNKNLVIQLSNKFSPVFFKLIGIVFLFFAAATQATVAAERIDNRSGYLVFREKPFYADDLVKCVVFSSVESRLAINNPDHGYLVFYTPNGQLRLPPQAIEGQFFIDELKFPKLMTPTQDLSRLTGLEASLKRVSGLNETVRHLLANPTQQVIEAVQRLKNDEWWEGKGGWVSREGRDKRTAQIERSQIDAVHDETEVVLKAASDTSDIKQALELIGELGGLPATSSELAAYRQSITTKLRSATDQRLFELEEEYIKETQHKLKSRMDDARSLDEILGVELSVAELEKATFSSPQASESRDAAYLALVTLFETKAREMRIKESKFGGLDAWRKALDQYGEVMVHSDDKTAAMIERSESLYGKAHNIGNQLSEASLKLSGFFADLPAQAVLSGEELPPSPPTVEKTLKNYHDFVWQLGDSQVIIIGELEAKADLLKKDLELYHQLRAISKRVSRRDIWQNAMIYERVLNQMPRVKAAFSDESDAYNSFIEAAIKYEASRDFAAAARSYQSANNIAPSVDLANKVKAMQDQDLGL